MVSWWIALLDEQLSQGDVLLDLPIASLTDPVEYLEKGTAKGGIVVWYPRTVPVPDKENRLPLLVKGKTVPAIVLSHDCELDKPRGAARVTVAPIAPIANLQPDFQARVIAQRVIAMLPVQGCPTLPQECYADFRSIASVPRSIVDKLTRIAGMSETGKLRLQAQLVRHFTHREPEI